MTNLQRWLMYAGVYLAITATIQMQTAGKWTVELQLLPIIFVILFGIYAACTVLYRTFTFNDCPQAAKELTQQIEEARRDLISKGFTFRD